MEQCNILSRGRTYRCPVRLHTDEQIVGVASCVMRVPLTSQACLPHVNKHWFFVCVGTKFLCSTKLVRYQAQVTIELTRILIPLVSNMLTTADPDWPAGRARLLCHCRASKVGTQSRPTQELSQQAKLHGKSDPPAPRSPFNTGSMDITTSGATTSLCGHDIPIEKTIIIVRHGLTTWNEQSRIQAILPIDLACACSCISKSAMKPCYIQGTAEEPDITPYGEEQAKRARDALSRMHIDRSLQLGFCMYMMTSPAILSSSRSLRICIAWFPDGVSQLTLHIFCPAVC